MPRIYWTPKRKARLLKDAETLTLKQLARKYFRSTNEIEDLLKMLRPGKKTILRTYKEGGKKVKVYRAGFAHGVEAQMVGQLHTIY